MKKTGEKAREAVNWNRLEDPLTLLIWQQNIRQFWVDEELPLSADKNVWLTLNRDEKKLYTRVLAGLTLLDTEQANVGMPRIGMAVGDLSTKSVLSFMAMMEHMHAKSYSSIFSTLCNSEEIDQLFAWVRQEGALQEKIQLILQRYESIRDDKSLFMAMVASVMLETFLFYSGFFYPLLLAGAGKMVNSGEIINLIIRDESVHGTYVGLLAQQLFERFTQKEQHELNRAVESLAADLFRVEEVYISRLYADLGMERQVATFSRYNCDKAFMNLGLEPLFHIKDSEINPVVLRGLETKTKNHDFFSVKGNSYTKAIRVEEIQDEDFFI